MSSPTPTDAYKRYKELEEKLLAVMKAGNDVDDGEGDQLRDEMEPLWWTMTSDERDEVNNNLREHELVMSPRVLLFKESIDNE